jgi:hypothetical protein
MTWGNIGARISLESTSGNDCCYDHTQPKDVTSPNSHAVTFVQRSSQFLPHKWNDRAALLILGRVTLAD